MEITYNDAVEGITTYLNSKEFEKGLRVITSGELRAPGAVASVQILDNPQDFAKKSLFVRDMLKGLGVTVKHDDEVLTTFQVTEGMQLSDVEYFTLRPGVFRFVVDAIFGMFLKNLYPLSSVSQKAEE